MLRFYVLNLVMGITNGFLYIKYNFVRAILVIVIVIFIMDKFKNKNDAKKILFSFIALQILFCVFLIITEYLMGEKFNEFVFVILPVAQAFFVSIVIMLDGELYFVLFGVIMYIFNRSSPLKFHVLQAPIEY